MAPPDALCPRSRVLKLVCPIPRIESTYHTGEFATDIVMDNQGEQDNRYHGAYFGYAGSLLTTEAACGFRTGSRWAMSIYLPLNRAQ